jgi:hypothetical protein
MILFLYVNPDLPTETSSFIKAQKGMKSLGAAPVTASCLGIV